MFLEQNLAFNPNGNSIKIWLFYAKNILAWETVFIEYKNKI